MTKEEVRNALQASGEISRFSHTQNWDKAFKLYNELHPNDKKNPKCGSCYKTVSKWLLS